MNRIFKNLYILVQYITTVYNILCRMLEKSIEGSVQFYINIESTNYDFQG